MERECTGLVVEAHGNKPSDNLVLLHMQGRTHAHSSWLAIAEKALGVRSYTCVGGEGKVDTPNKAAYAKGVNLLCLRHAGVDHCAECRPELELSACDTEDDLAPIVIGLNHTVTSCDAASDNIHRVHDRAPEGRVHAHLYCKPTHLWKAVNADHRAWNGQVEVPEPARGKKALEHASNETRRDCTVHVELLDAFAAQHLRHSVATDSTQASHGQVADHI
mmetsp:Transcript_2917/g.4659  ORF Transcript_2917/g.4659 Transcript_2917/m.4659 type:complete len:219 (-) Transcript_2917:23-679(-)